jgi:hypothetical protein
MATRAPQVLSVAVPTVARQDISSPFPAGPLFGSAHPEKHLRHAVRSLALVPQAFFFFFQQVVDLFDKPHQLVRVLFDSSLLTQNAPPLGLFTFHSGKYLLNIYAIKNPATQEKTRSWHGPESAKRVRIDGTWAVILNNLHRISHYCGTGRANVGILTVRRRYG